MNKGNTTVIITIISITIVVIGLLLLPRLTQNNQEVAEGDKPPCLLPNLPLAIHTHQKLTIIVDDKEETIPGEIGLNGTCHRPVHTHDANGEIHIESQIIKEYTLGDFFTIWEKSITREGYTITMTVDDKQSDSFERHMLKDKENIVLTYKKL